VEIIKMVEIISKEQLLKKIQAKEPFILLDVRDTPDYNAHSFSLT